MSLFSFQRKHYKEYLVQLINNNGLDPVDAMNVEEVKRLMEKHYIEIPAPRNLLGKYGYLKKLKKVNFVSSGAVEGFQG